MHGVLGDASSLQKVRVFQTDPHGCGVQVSVERRHNAPLILPMEDVNGARHGHPVLGVQGVSPPVQSKHSQCLCATSVSPNNICGYFQHYEAGAQNFKVPGIRGQGQTIETQAHGNGKDPGVPGLRIPYMAPRVGLEPTTPGLTVQCYHR